MTSRLHVLRALELGLLGVGVICLVWYAGASARASRFQQAQNQSIEAKVCQSGCGPEADGPVADPKLVGRLEIPSVDISVVVMDGDDDGTLEMAAGHLPDTPLPWQPGNTAFAAHRDTYFRPLKDIERGAEIRLVSARGTFIYKVRDMRVVQPDDVSVLAADAQPTLTLVTCYPFYYVGNAPKRYVVRADLIATTPPGNEVR